jgi:hypothetical protein
MFQQTRQYDNFLDYFEVNHDQGGAGYHGYLASRLFDRQSLTGDTDALRGAISDILTTHGGLNPFLVTGKGVQEADPRGGGNAVNPSLRNSFVHASE